MLACFDLSSTTGVAWGTAQHRAPVPEVWNLPKGDLDRTLCMLRQQAMQHFQVTKTTHVAIELSMERTSREHSTFSLIFLKSLEAVVREAAARHGLAAPIGLVRPETWRKAFLGKGTMERADAKRAAKRRCEQLGWDYLGSEDAAEACGLWYYSAGHLWPKWRPQ